MCAQHSKPTQRGKADGYPANRRRSGKMEAGIRKTWCVEEWQAHALAHVAAEMHVTESLVLREILNEALAGISA
jgi:hypothetical protein